VVEDYVTIETRSQENQSKVLKEAYRKDGDMIYELYSVMIHSGSAWGGHYYSYIKSFEDGMWYNFDDSTVSRISPKEIESVFGDEIPKKSK
jgi:ubiquitin carboxyl-terminal hydrolase 47